MKKTILLFMLLLNLCFGMKSVFAQCPGSGSATGATPSGYLEIMVGQTISNTCAYTMTGLTVQLLGGYTSAGTMTLRVYSGNHSCSGGILLKSGTATSGKSGAFTISLSSSLSLAATTIYHLELTSTNNADVRNLISTYNPATYADGQYYYSASVGNCNYDPDSDLTFTLAGSVLPIELMSFDVQTTKESKNLLTWRTASESQNKGFDIERSADGVRFNKIGFVAGNGTTNTRKDYRFEDTRSSSPLERSGEVVYYRLKQLDFDGRFEYSKIIAIDRKGENVMSIFPNPSKGIFTITGIEDSEEETFTLINTVGQTLSINVQNDGQLDMLAYPSGVYYLRVASSGQVMKLVKE